MCDWYEVAPKFDLHSCEVASPPQQIFVLKGRLLHPRHLSKCSVKTLLCPADHKSSDGEMRLKSEEEEEEEEEKEEEEEDKTM